MSKLKFYVKCGILERVPMLFMKVILQLQKSSVREQLEVLTLGGKRNGKQQAYHQH